MRYCPICKKGIERSFGVPQDAKQRERWSKICGVELNRNSRVCMDHFPTSSIITMGKRLQLMPYAMPVERNNYFQSSINNKHEQPSCNDTENRLHELTDTETVTTTHMEEFYEDSEIEENQLPENDDNPVEFKCGEIFCLNFTQLQISCDFCNSKQFNLEDFLIHLRNVHVQNDELTTKLLDDIKSKNFQMQIITNEEEETEEEGGDEDKWLEGFEEVHTLVEKENADYIPENNEINADHYDEDEIDSVSFQQEENEHEVDESVEEEKENEYDEVDYEVDEDEVSEKEKQSMQEEDVDIAKMSTFTFEEDENSEASEENSENYKDNCEIDEISKANSEFTSLPPKDDTVKVHTVKKKRKRSSVPKVLLEFPCPECPQQFILKKLLDNHVFENHGGYKCSKCDKRFRKRQHLIIHEERHNSPLYSCTVAGCNKAFADIEYCKRHIENHSTELKFICSYENCGKGFLSLLRLKLHKKMHMKGYVNGNVKRLNFVCDICGYSCHASVTLQIHQRIHSGEKPYRCDVCGNHYISQYALKKHSISHSNERNYKCDICDARFKSSEVLGRHKFLHSDSRQFICNYCGKDFKQPHCRDAHIKQVHKGIKHIRAKRKRKPKAENAKIVIERLNMDG